METDYDDFISQINLLDIHLTYVEYRKLANPSPDEYSHIEVNYKPKKITYCQKKNCFEISQDILFSISECDDVSKNKPRKLFDLKATFALVYESKIPLNDNLFDLFKVRNIPINIHPYVRELIQNALVKVGLPGFTLPVLRIKK